MLNLACRLIGTIADIRVQSNSRRGRAVGTSRRTESCKQGSRYLSSFSPFPSCMVAMSSRDRGVVFRQKCLQNILPASLLWTCSYYTLRRKRGAAAPPTARLPDERDRIAKTKRAKMYHSRLAKSADKFQFSYGVARSRQTVSDASCDECHIQQYNAVAVKASVQSENGQPLSSSIGSSYTLPFFPLPSRSSILLKSSVRPSVRPLQYGYANIVSCPNLREPRADG